MDENQKDILLAEDDIDDVLIFELAMQRIQKPYLLRHAESGTVLFTLLEERIPYILFLDIHMPCEDGISCILKIRKNSAYDNLPIVMLTSASAKKTVETCFRSGANLFVEKAHTMHELADRLKKVFAIDWKTYLHYPPLEQFIIE
jgi:CheY-like chemotaxis protein